MRAVLLAAGLGTRLRPLTDGTPKCLLDVGGTTLLDRWLDALALAGVDDVLVNVHHLRIQVEDHLERRRGGPRVRVAHEPTLLGSAGTLRANAAWLRSGGDFLAINADNLTSYDLRDLVAAHRSRPALATIAVFRSPEPSRCGIVQTDEEGRVVGFEEKPARPRSDLANAGIYAFTQDVLSLLTEETPLDIGYDLLPLLVGRARAVDIGSCYFADIGTHEALASARMTWPTAGDTEVVRS